MEMNSTQNQFSLNRAVSKTNSWQAPALLLTLFLLLMAGLTTHAALPGTVVAWGYNDYGQTSVPVGLSGVTAIAGGGAHTVALKNDGTVVAWGYNGSGQTSVPVGLRDRKSVV